MADFGKLNAQSCVTISQSPSPPVPKIEIPKLPKKTIGFCIFPPIKTQRYETPINAFIEPADVFLGQSPEVSG